MNTNKIKRTAAPFLMVGMLFASSGVAYAASTSTFDNIPSGSSTTRKQAAVGTHSIKVSDCGGPAKMEIRVDVFGPDLSEGSNTPVCNSGTSATIFGTRDSRNGNGHFVQNRSTQRTDIRWTRPT